MEFPQEKTYTVEDIYALPIGQRAELIELVPEKDIDVLYRVITKFIPEADPEPDELEAIAEGRKDRAENGTVPHEAINWD